MSDAHEPLTFGEPRPVNIVELETELSRLWRSAAEDPQTQYAVTRACALTLLVYVESEPESHEVLNLINGVTPRNPCRAVVIAAEPRATPTGLTASISALCHLPAAGDKQVCCEEISVLARGEAVDALDQVINPLMVPGLPVYLWWRAGRFIAPKYLDRVLRAVDCILVDSARFLHPEADFGPFLEQVQKFSGDLAFADLNWARLTPCRELIAQCFDSAESRPCLDWLTEVRIESEHHSPQSPGFHSQSLLLAAWLATRLRWEPLLQRTESNGGNRLFYFESREAAVKVHIVSRQCEDKKEEGFALIRLVSGGAHPAACSLVGAIDSVAVRSEISGRQTLERSVRLRIPDEVDLVSEELRYPRRDHVYEEVLGMAARLATAARSSN